MYMTRAALLLLTPLLALSQSTSGSNAFKVPPSGYAVEAGKPITLEWTPSTQGTVSLYLREGNSANLSKGTPIATGIQNSGTYTWNVPTSAVRGAGYAVEIVDDSNPANVNYTPQFALASDNLSSASSASGSSSSVTSSASMSVTSSNSASTTGSSSSSRSTGSSSTGTRTSSNPAGLQTPASTGGVGPVATMGMGMVGGLALAALAL